MREPPVRSRNRSVRRDEICVTGSARLRAAANSMASGRPSRRAQMSAITFRTASESSKDAPAACARAMDNSAAPPGAERRNRPHGLARYPQCLAAGGDKPQAGTVVQQNLGRRRGRVDDVFAVVEDDDHFAVADHVGKPLRVGHVERRRDRALHRGRITDRRQLDEVAAAGQCIGGGARRVPTRAGSCRHRPDRRG